MDDLLKFLAARISEDGHHVADTRGGDALLDSHLRILDAMEVPANDCSGMPDPWDGRTHGLTHALRVLAQAYAAHPAYREEWRPQEAVKETCPPSSPRDAAVAPPGSAA
ncbi:DUF6221 family protein [Streptomyces phaeofaciens]|uniref:DUF6221 family protein n=1 Tax=Streptomyces phaeofaciens TaxID=68254 RepID=UPI00369286D1